MAKRRHRDLSTSPGHYHWIPGDLLTPLDAARSIKPARIQLALAKHSPNTTAARPSPSALTLGSLFASLPSELRRHIFSFLLVRPPKWDIVHDPACVYSQTAPHAGLDTSPSQPDEYACPGHDYYHFRTWRTKISSGAGEKRLTWQDPWRSRWAPEVANEFVCSQCWDGRLRPLPRPDPKRRELMCLCARREGLEVQLVSEFWYMEAGSAKHILLRGRGKLYRFLQQLGIPLAGKAEPCQSSLHRQPKRQPRRHCHIATRPVGSHRHASRAPDALTLLELDAVLLSSRNAVSRLLRMGLRHVKSVSFALQRPDTLPQRPFRKVHPYVLPNLEARVLFRRGFAEEIARGMKGQRRKFFKASAGKKELKDAVESNEIRLLWIGTNEKDSGGGGEDTSAEDTFDRSVLNCDDTGEWNRMWPRSRAYRSAYMPQTTIKAR